MTRLMRASRSFATPVQISRPALTHHASLSTLDRPLNVVRPPHYVGCGRQDNDESVLRFRRPGLSRTTLDNVLVLLSSYASET